MSSPRPAMKSTKSPPSTSPANTKPPKLSLVTPGRRPTSKNEEPVRPRRTSLAPTSTAPSSTAPALRKAKSTILRTSTRNDGPMKVRTPAPLLPQKNALPTPVTPARLRASTASVRARTTPIVTKQSMPSLRQHPPQTPESLPQKSVVRFPVRSPSPSPTSGSKRKNSLTSLEQSVPVRSGADLDKISLTPPPTKTKKPFTSPSTPPLSSAVSTRAVSHYDALLLKAHSQIRDLQAANKSLNLQVLEMQVDLDVARDDNEWTDIAKSALQLELDVRRQNDAILKYGESRRKNICWSDHSSFYKEINTLKEDNQFLRRRLAEEERKHEEFAMLQDRTHELVLQEEKCAEERARMQRLNTELQDAVIVCKRQSGLRLTDEEMEWERSLPNLDPDQAADSPLSGGGTLYNSPVTGNSELSSTSLSLRPSYKDDAFRHWTYPSNPTPKGRAKEPRDYFWAGMEENDSQSECGIFSAEPMMPSPTKLDFSRRLVEQDPCNSIPFPGNTEFSGSSID